MARVVPQPLCTNCAAHSPVAPSNRITLWDELVRSLPSMRVMRFVAFIPATVFGALGLFVHPLFFIPAVLCLFPALWLISVHQRARANNSPQRITDAQVFALVRQSDNKLTATRLAAATRSTEEAARRRLQHLALDNVLEVTSTDTELAYGLPSTQTTSADRLDNER